MKQQSNQTLYVMYEMTSFLFMVSLAQMLVGRQKVSFNLQGCSSVFSSHPVYTQPFFFGGGWVWGAGVRLQITV